MSFKISGLKVSSLRTSVAALAGIVLLATMAAAQADAYKPGDYLLLNLREALLSPKLLGPPATFEHVQVEAKTDAKAADAETDLTTAPVKAAVKSKLAHAPMATGASRRKLARTRSNPLDANAADTRIQVWPCRAGGICNWHN